MMLPFLSTTLTSRAPAVFFFIAAFIACDSEGYVPMLTQALNGLLPLYCALYIILYSR
jgi:hypothetical protein